MASSLMLINPRKRRAAKKSRKAPVTARGKKRAAKNRSKHIAGYYPNPVRKRARGYRRNPIGGTGIVGQLMTSVQGGAIGAAGAIGAKIVTSFLPLPLALKSGNMAPVSNALLGAGFGALVGKFANKQLGAQIGVGAVTVALYDVMRTTLAGKVPGLSATDEMFDDMGAYYMGENDDTMEAYDTGMSETDADGNYEI